MLNCVQNATDQTLLQSNIQRHLLRHYAYWAHAHIFNRSFTFHPLTMHTQYGGIQYDTN